MSDAHVVRDRTTGQSRGFGFVTFVDPAVARAVMMTDHKIDGRDVMAIDESSPAAWAAKQVGGEASRRRSKLGAAELSGCWSSKCCGCVPGCAYVCFPFGDYSCDGVSGCDDCMCIINTCPLVCLGPICYACRLGEHQQWVCT